MTQPDGNLAQLKSHTCTLVPLHPLRERKQVVNFATATDQRGTTQHNTTHSLPSQRHTEQRRQQQEGLAEASESGDLFAHPNAWREFTSWPPVARFPPCVRRTTTCTFQGGQPWATCHTDIVHHWVCHLKKCFQTIYCDRNYSDKGDYHQRCFKKNSTKMQARPFKIQRINGEI